MLCYLLRSASCLRSIGSPSILSSLVLPSPHCHLGVKQLHVAVSTYCMHMCFESAHLAKFDHLPCLVLTCNQQQASSNQVRFTLSCSSVSFLAGSLFGCRGAEMLSAFHPASWCLAEPSLDPGAPRLIALLITRFGVGLV